MRKDRVGTPVRLLITGLMVVFLASCALYKPEPDLERLYRVPRENRQQPPVVIIPGLMGTRLVDADGREAWPGSSLKLLTSRYADLALPLPQDRNPAPGGDSLYPGGLFERAAGRQYYSRILAVLETAGGYHRGTAGVPVRDGKPGYYVMTYDWRQDAIDSTIVLDKLIDQIRLDYGDPELRVDVIAHSLGGLIARYYARYGRQDLLEGNEFPVTHEGARKLRRLILVGTSNLGSLEAMHALIEGRASGLRTTPPEVIMTMPSIYQLFPHALHEWLYTASGKPLQRDQFDAYIWERFEMGPWNPGLQQRVVNRMGENQGNAYLTALKTHFSRQLERARRFTWSLSVPEVANEVPIIVFGGDCNLTPARLVVEEVNEESVLRLWPWNIANPLPGIDYEWLMMEPGDGTVTKASLLGRDALDPAAPRHPYLHFEPDSAFFICEQHELLTSNITFQDNLLHALLRID